MPTDESGLGTPHAPDSGAAGIPDQPVGFDPQLAAEVNAALVGELDEGLAVDPQVPFGDERRLFAALYVRHRYTIAQQARKYLHDARDVDEVVQETFLRLFLALPDLESEAQAIAWSRRTATNLCIDRYRAAQRRPRLIDLDLVEHELVVDEEPSDPLVQAEDAAIVRHAMALLPPQYREALVKREIEEKALPQIAAELGIPEESVKHLLYRARRALRRLLVGSGLEPVAHRGKSIGSALLIILTVIFGLPALRSSMSDGPRDAEMSSAPVPTGSLSTAPDARAGTPAAPAAGELAPEVTAAAPPIGHGPAVVAGAPTGTVAGEELRPPRTSGAAPELAAPPVRDPAVADITTVATPARKAPIAPTTTTTATTTTPARSAPAPAAMATADVAVAPESAVVAPVVEAPGPVVPIEQTYARFFTLDGGGSLDGTGTVEEMGVQSLSSGQQLAQSRFVASTTTGDLALHQNVTREQDGRVSLDVVPVMFDDSARQLVVEVTGTTNEFIRRDDGTFLVRSHKVYTARPIAPPAELSAVVPGQPGSMVVEMLLSSDLQTVISESVTVR
ncbi:MAG TPA: sigma-70 family RNA polymerase sigma factor [Mycobacteriales bacterium]|nr:sigma-70 family RNA polymerase sigma factor [Mycobacteriales bacterium]